MKTNFLIAITLISVCLFSCKKSSTTKSDELYFTASFNGQAINIQAKEALTTDFYVNSTVHKGVQKVGTTPFNWQYDTYVGTEFNKLSAPTDVASVYLLKRFVGGDEPNDAQKRAMLKTGSFNYGKSNINGTTTDGAVIDYINTNGVYFSTEFGSQAGSSFVITEVIDNPTGNSEKILKATFTCKLYQENNPSNVITVTNGTVRGKMF